MAGKKADSQKLGRNVIIAGLFIQIVFFGVFVVTTAMFHIRMRKAPTAKSADPNLSWTKHMSTLYAASALILIRSTMRIIEYIQGNQGYILKHEAFLYVFDGALMLVVLVLYNIVHPSKVTASRGSKNAAGVSHVDIEAK